MIFKGVREGKPYPEHGLSYRDWSKIPPRQIRLDEMVTTTTVLALDRLLSEDSTFYGDLFPHAVKWKGIVYLEDGLHRGAGGPAEPHRAACAATRSGRRRPTRLTLGHVLALAGVEIDETCPQRAS
jgi:Arc/MetJ family transcription regulator